VAQGLVRYRCFLPDLTGFTAPPCTGPNYQQSTSYNFSESRDRRPDPRLAFSTGFSAFPSGGEGGIRTPGTLVRGTHDFQSCTFNRSVTSPVWHFEHLRALPCSSQLPMSPKCLHGKILGRFANCFVNLTQQIIVSKDESQKYMRYTIGIPVMKKNSWSLTYLLADVSKMSPGILYGN
jgi:hypothetical protein